MLLCVGTLFGECTKDCELAPDIQVEILTKCEKDKLDAAEKRVLEIKQEILRGHGQPQGNPWVGGGAYFCALTKYKTYELNADGYVVIKTYTFTPCSTLVVTSN